MQIVLSKEEASNLRGLLDIAVKAGGIAVAGAAAVLDQKVIDADKAEEEKNPKPVSTEADAKPRPKRKYTRKTPKPTSTA